MSIILRFIGRMLFAPLWLVVLLILAVVVLVLLAAGVVSVGCVVFAALLGLGYWVRHDPEMGRGAIEVLLSGVGIFALLVAIYGMIWDAFCAVRDWGGPPTSGLQLRHSDEDFDETPVRTDP
jgi:hypothetical protein